VLGFFPARRSIAAALPCLLKFNHSLIHSFIMLTSSSADLDFIGSAITFCSLGQMAGILSKDGDIPRSNIAFVADASASMMGGLLGSSGGQMCAVEVKSSMSTGLRTVRCC
jgi:xanthine/uracil/vitamin C permease (AzgA family)